MKKLLLLGLALTLTACAGRDPKPIPQRSHLDATMTCDAMELEKEANRTLMAHLAEEDNDENVYNLVVTGVALLVTPAVIAYDLSNAEEVETNSLIKRNKRLDALRVARGCITEAQAPEGYNSFTRGAMAYTDASGRQVKLTTNRYTYDPNAALQQPARAQYGRAELPSLY